MQKIWQSQYQAGVPTEIGPLEFSSLADVLARSARLFRDRPSYINMGKTLSFGDLDRLSDNFAAWLQKDAGLAKGTRIALMLPNLLQFPVAFFGSLKAGLVLVNVNPLYTSHELEHQLRDSGAEAIVVLANFANTLEKIIHHTAVKHVIITQIGDLFDFPKRLLVNTVVKRVKRMVPHYLLPGHIRFNQALRRGATYKLDPVKQTPSDIALLQYTGGTTGTAKGAMLTHGNILSNMMQLRAWVGDNMRQGEELVVTPLPLYHILSLTGNCLTFGMMGAANLLITNPRDISGFIKDLSRHKMTFISGVNTLYNALLNHPDFKKLDFSRLKISLAGGMPTQRAVAERWKAVTGNALIEAYGLTETSPGVFVNPLDLPEFNGMVGLPLPSTEVEVRDDTGRVLPQGEAGELFVRGPQVMQGYWNQPEETARVLGADGFIATGDIAEMSPQGFFRIVDRKKDMILVSGFNVYPNEIEDVVMLHPGVLETACIGVPDTHSGEAVRLFVVRKDPQLTVESIKSHCRRYLTKYKVPHLIEFCDQLPKSNVGKVLRRALREGGAQQQSG